MKNAIIIHGSPSKREYEDISFPSPAQSHWIPWIKEELELKGISTVTPEMPVPYEPQYELWSHTFKAFIINEGTSLVGHSSGAGFLVRWLSENNVSVGKVVLIAPWIDPEKEFTTGMFDFIIDPELISRTKGLVVFYSIDDDDDIIKTVDELKAALPQAIFKEFSDKGHFTLGDMGTREFPELLEVLSS